jgi:hypothetical protein
MMMAICRGGGSCISGFFFSNNAIMNPHNTTRGAPRPLLVSHTGSAGEIGKSEWPEILAQIKDENRRNTLCISRFSI